LFSSRREGNRKKRKMVPKRRLHHLSFFDHEEDVKEKKKVQKRNRGTPPNRKKEEKGKKRTGRAADRGAVIVLRHPEGEGGKGSKDAERRDIFRKEGGKKMEEKAGCTGAFAARPPLEESCSPPRGKKRLEKGKKTKFRKRRALASLSEPIRRRRSCMGGGGRRKKEKSGRSSDKLRPRPRCAPSAKAG